MEVNNNNIIANIIEVPDAMTNLYQIDISYNHNLSEGIYSKNFSKLLAASSRDMVISNNTIDYILQRSSYRVPQVMIPPQNSSTVDLPYQGTSMKKVAPGASLDKVLTLPIRIDENFELYSLFQAACPVDINGIEDSFYGNIEINNNVTDDLLNKSFLPSFEIKIMALKNGVNTSYKDNYCWSFHNCYVSSIEGFTLDYSSSDSLSVNIKFLYSYMELNALNTAAANLKAEEEQQAREEVQRKIEERRREIEAQRKKVYSQESKENLKIRSKNSKMVSFELEPDIQEKIKREIYSQESRENLDIFSKEAKTSNFELAPDVQSQIKTDQRKEEAAFVKEGNNYLEGNVPQNDPRFFKKVSIKKAQDLKKAQEEEAIRIEHQKNMNKYLESNSSDMSSILERDIKRQRASNEAAIKKDKEWSLDRQNIFKEALIEKDTKELGTNFAVTKWSKNNPNINYYKGSSKKISLGASQLKTDPTQVQNILEMSSIKNTMEKKPSANINHKKLEVSAANFTGIRSPLHRFNPTFNLGYGIIPNPNLNNPNISKYIEKSLILKGNKK